MAEGRRQRTLPTAEAVLIEGLGTKLLHGWLQNRHQTLFPLTLNFSTLTERQAMLLAQVMAVTMLAGTGPADATRVEAAVAFLAGAGAAEATQDALRAALGLPPPLSRLIFDVQHENIAATAFVVAVAATPGGDAAAEGFLAYLALRLELPDPVVRSARRRYRR